MEPNIMPTQEEIQQMLEKAQRDWQAALEKMTQEERAQAKQRAQKMVEEDNARMQALLDNAASVAAGIPSKAKPRFCTNCGAPVSGGKFCTNCGSPLQ